MVWPVGLHTEGNTIKRKVLRSNFLPKNRLVRAPRRVEGKGERSDANFQLPQNKRKQSVMTAFFVYFVIPKILPHPSFIEINFYDCLRASEKVASNLYSRLL